MGCFINVLDFGQLQKNQTKSKQNQRTKMTMAKKKIEGHFFPTYINSAYKQSWADLAIPDH